MADSTVHIHVQLPESMAESFKRMSRDLSHVHGALLSFKTKAKAFDYLVQDIEEILDREDTASYDFPVTELQAAVEEAKKRATDG